MSAGGVINKKAEICPKCGVRQRRPASKAVLLLLTFFLGGLGVHRFYIGSYLLGTIYFVLFWTGIPALLSLIEFIVFIFISSETIEEKYEAKNGAVLVIIPIFVVIVLAILAAIAIPAYTDYLRRSKVAEAIGLLAGLKTSAEEYMSIRGRFPSVEEVGGKDHGKYTESIKSYPNGLYFEAVMNRTDSFLGGKTIRLTYNPESKTWTCSAEGENALSPRYLPSTCK